jgi:hypothetical protein
MSVDKAKKTLDIAGHGLQALEVIGDLIGRYTKGNPHPHADIELATALNVIGTIASVVGAVRSSLDGSTSVEDLEKEIAKMRTDLKQNDTAIDDSIDAKFRG